MIVTEICNIVCLFSLTAQAYEQNRPFLVNIGAVLSFSESVLLIFVEIENESLSDRQHVCLQLGLHFQIKPSG